MVHGMPATCVFQFRGKKPWLVQLTHFKHLQVPGKFSQVHALNKFKLDTQVLTTGLKHKPKEIIKRIECGVG